MEMNDRLKQSIFAFIIFLEFCLPLYSLCQGTNECMVCQRLSTFNEIKKRVAKIYWPSFSHQASPPLLYFSDSLTYIAFTQKFPFASAYHILRCPQGQELFVTNRIDSIPFHMENRMDLDDSTSPLFFRPMLFCSDVERLVKTVPDFSTTEEWFQLIMHEYFHSFQFSHRAMLSFLHDKIKIKEDSLTSIYRGLKWFASMTDSENILLLKAINTPFTDSLRYYIRKFIAERTNRREQFRDSLGYDISIDEDFWEKAEGTARYLEYYTAFAYKNLNVKTAKNCDSLFKNFSWYRNRDLAKEKNFYIRTQIMPAYYYVTGFNLCRLLDKVHVAYKKDLFTEPRESLFWYLREWEERVRTARM
jgi:hypothetical protein